ncbi:MAG: universal stress protein [Nitrospira sp.]|nr:universal stress protein [Nitrospira sp.]
MGTRGKTGLAHVLLGSTAERIIRGRPFRCWPCEAKVKAGGWLSKADVTLLISSGFWCRSIFRLFARCAGIRSAGCATIKSLSQTSSCLRTNFVWIGLHAPP